MPLKGAKNSKGVSSGRKVGRLEGGKELWRGLHTKHAFGYVSGMKLFFRG
jgi:hypothetical protein